MISPCWSTLFQALDAKGILLEDCLNALASKRWRDFVAGLVKTGDRDQLRLEALAENARLRVAIDARKRSPAHSAVNMDIAAGNQLRTGADRTDNDQIALIGKNPLPRAHRLG